MVTKLKLSPRRGAGGEEESDGHIFKNYMINRAARSLHFHNKRHRRLKPGISRFFGTGNQLVAF